MKSRIFQIFVIGNPKAFDFAQSFDMSMTQFAMVCFYVSLFISLYSDIIDGAQMDFNFVLSCVPLFTVLSTKVVAIAFLNIEVTNF